MTRRIVGIVVGLVCLAGPAAAQTLYQASVTLTDAQIKALPSTPVDVAPAPGAGKQIVFGTALLRPDFVAGYTNVDLGDATFQLSLEQGALVTSILGNVSGFATPLQALLNATSTGTYSAQLGPVGNWTQGYGLMATADFALGASSAVNKKLTTTVWNGSSNNNFTGGHPSNTLTISVLYYVLNTLTGQFE